MLFTALTGPGLLMVAQVFLGANATASVTILTLSLFCHGAITGGYLSNGLDIAPNFAGTIFGMANTLSSFGGFLSNLMVGALTFADKVSFFLVILGKMFLFLYIEYLIASTKKIPRF